MIRGNGPDLPIDHEGTRWQCGQCGLKTQGGGEGLEQHKSVVHEYGSMKLCVCSNDAVNDYEPPSNDAS